MSVTSQQSASLRVPAGAPPVTCLSGGAPEKSDDLDLPQVPMPSYVVRRWIAATFDAARLYVLSQRVDAELAKPLRRFADRLYQESGCAAAPPDELVRLIRDQRLPPAPSPSVSLVESLVAKLGDAREPAAIVDTIKAICGGGMESPTPPAVNDPVPPLRMTSRNGFVIESKPFAPREIRGRPETDQPL